MPGANCVFKYLPVSRTKEHEGIGLFHVLIISAAA